MGNEILSKLWSTHERAVVTVIKYTDKLSSLNDTVFFRHCAEFRLIISQQQKSYEIEESERISFFATLHSFVFVLCIS